ncbi:hypothetical protein EA462_07610 [Natrarchaeobius halalkaliphilus]|uniref:Transporter n=1 Tax=Natrarchaeobius halalkaliphilus TaxID=1679091 RepID=A0A3N6MWL1_9EURY|nr:hypothetical protein [Natrarchaeobius halalkaliphilus]RQG89872.1 hypothetical protein EA462_07610 [Natrarchaeobius halalkaliphilus]
MKFDLAKTTVAFALIVALGAAALLVTPMMAVDTVLMMVVPSMIVFGAIALVIGVKHGEYRAAR